MTKSPVLPNGELQKSDIDDWLRTSEMKRLLKIGNTRLYQLINSGAFPVSRPAGGLIYARRSDVVAFLKNGYTDKTHQTIL